MEQLKHECGVAMIRLLKPLEYYHEKYGTMHYALNKLYLLMEKQHNRGQEGAGLACVRLSAKPGDEYMFRQRAAGTTAITEIFNAVHQQQVEAEKGKDDLTHGGKRELPPFIGELYMGHLRYSTTGKSGLDYIHPFLRRNNWRAKNLALCGNFNLTNVDEIFQRIVANGQHPRKYADTHILLEQVGHRLDREVERVYNRCSAEGKTGLELTHAIEKSVDMANVLRTSSCYWDGGYVMCGITGSGESFALRDPWGIRTAFWYQDDEIMMLASERPVIQTTLDVSIDEIHELEPGQALIARQDGSIRLEQINKKKPLSACSFERIYFSRGSDSDIYRERKELGRLLVSQILPAIDYDIQHTIFSYIPNTAEVAYHGMMDGIRQHCVDTGQSLSLVRAEKVVWKDIKLRTFIAEGNSRNDLAAHVYDITYGSVVPNVDNLVIIDDSIVRGTTLRESIIRILFRLHPRKIIIVSSAPQVRYPDFYGIDMSGMGQFIAFKAAVSLIRERNMEPLLNEVYEACKSDDSGNPVRRIYHPFTAEELNRKMVELLQPKDVLVPVQLIFQSLEGLHQAIPRHAGDWYFSGNYPTPGGEKLCRQAYINWYENKNER
ncbi:MAG: amidophosphoribosyltransferase [Prevotellaceae bacterium]|nr:amidophosphoribosyltransferase [Prevotellaceae bacterium]